MANSKTQKPAQDNVGIGEIPAGHAITIIEDKIAHISEQYSEERDIANQVLGQAQAFRVMAKFADVVSLSKLQYIKENKLYRAFQGKTIILPDGSESRLVGTWAEYCELLGSSSNKIDEDLINLRTFGEEALENMQRIGAGYREMRKLRKLPDDVRQQVAGQLVNLDDKEEIVALIDDLAAKHTREKDELTKKLNDLQADAEATDKVLGDKSAKLDQLEKEIHKLRNKAGDWHPRAFEVAMETTRSVGMAMEQMDKLDQLRDAILNEDFGDDVREQAIEAMAVVYYDGVERVIARLKEIVYARDEVFIGYAEKASPILEVFGQQGQEN